MSQTTPQLQIATAPFLHRGLSTRRLMWEVLGCSGCASRGIHARCGGLEDFVEPDWFCYSCRRVVGVRGEERGEKPIRTVWGAAAATRNGAENK